MRRIFLNAFILSYFYLPNIWVNSLEAQTVVIIRGAPTPLNINFSVNWQCPNISSEVGIPTSLEFNLGIDVENPSVVNLALNRLLTQITETRAPVHECLRAFRNEIDRQAQIACIQSRYPDVPVTTRQSLGCSIELNSIFPSTQFDAILPLADEIESSSLQLNLYPLHEIPTPLNQEQISFLQNMADEMIQDCGVSPIEYRNGGLSFVEGKYFRLSRNFIDDYLTPRLRRASQNCQHSIMADLVRTISFDLPGVCNGTPQSDQRPSCELFRSQMESFFIQMQEFFPPESLSTFMPTCPELEAETLSRMDLINLSLLTRTIDNCAPLANGEARIINQINSGANVGANYRLVKRSENNYQATINVRFSPTDRTEFTNACLARANPLTTPSGRRLEVAITTSPNDENQGAIQNIQIAPNSRITRSNSGVWRQDIDCDTVVHELMHLAGLVDDYHEEDIAPIFEEAEITQDPVARRMYEQNNCRLETAPRSIMGSSHGMLNLANSGRVTLLNEEQFNMVTSGGCYHQSQVYLNCSVGSYETQTSAGGQGCSPTPPYCSDREQRLRAQSSLLPRSR